MGTLPSAHDKTQIAATATDDRATAKPPSRMCAHATRGGARSQAQSERVHYARFVIDEVLEFWFEKPATTAEAYGRKIRRWYMGGPTLDAEIRQRFASLVERALVGELDEWASTPRGRLALILLLDQFTRSIFRNDERTYAGDTKAQVLAVEAVDRGLDRDLSIEERQFLIMPLLHAENLSLQERAVAEMDRIVADAADFQKGTVSMGIEQARKYRDIIARFGRFPHRNQILGRQSTEEEKAFLVGWEEKMKPKGADTLPG
jgi:uncharacterized protein (DUF924 family)